MDSEDLKPVGIVTTATLNTNAVTHFSTRSPQQSSSQVRQTARATYPTSVANGFFFIASAFVAALLSPQSCGSCFSMRYVHWADLARGTQDDKRVVHIRHTLFDRVHRWCQSLSNNSALLSPATRIFLFLIWSYSIACSNHETEGVPKNLNAVLSRDAARSKVDRKANCLHLLSLTCGALDEPYTSAGSPYIDTKRRSTQSETSATPAEKDIRRKKARNQCRKEGKYTRQTATCGFAHGKNDTP